MTERLYDSDARLFDFTATVLSCRAEHQDFTVTLDRSAFFPNEGGQEADRGTLGDANVLDVQLCGGELYHRLDRPLTVGAVVEGHLDAARRRRHMQVHTGEHILSGVLHRLYGAKNVGFHLGKSEVTLDTDIPLDDEMLANAEEAANRAVFENRPVRILYPEPRELPLLEYRAKLALNEGVRLVEIEGVDLCACCAPHVQSTGECGLIKIVSSMRYKGGTRLFIAVGVDALADYREKQRTVHTSSVLLSLPEGEVAAGISRLLDTLGEERRRLFALAATLRHERLLPLVGKQNEVLTFADMDAAALRAYAEEGAGLLCGAFLVLSEAGDTCRYALASQGGDVKPLAARLHAALGGRGGGKPTLVQGSFACSAEAACAAFRRL